MSATENGGPERCPVEYTIEVIGGKYKPLILWHLQAGALRFGELRRRVPTATAKMLTQHLRELENHGLINRKIFPVIPPKVEYSLTRLGASVMPVMQAMSDWGSAHRNRPAATSRRRRAATKAV